MTDPPQETPLSPTVEHLRNVAAECDELAGRLTGARRQLDPLPVVRVLDRVAVALRALTDTPPTPAPPATSATASGAAGSGPTTDVEFEVTGATYPALLANADTTIAALADGHPYRLTTIDARPHTTTQAGSVVCWRADITATITTQ